MLLNFVIVETFVMRKFMWSKDILVRVNKICCEETNNEAFCQPCFEKKNESWGLLFTSCYSDRGSNVEEVFVGIYNFQTIDEKYQSGKKLGQPENHHGIIKMVINSLRRIVLRWRILLFYYLVLSDNEKKCALTNMLNFECLCYTSEKIEPYTFRLRCCVL